MNPLVSIIVPIYKVEPYLRRCIDSVLAQDFRELEVILVDDGSPDNCGAICDEYAAKYKFIKVIHQKNGGLSAARNAGLDVARGEFVHFVDSDDYLAPGLLRSVLGNLTDEIDLLTFGHIAERNDGRSGQTVGYPERTIPFVDDVSRLRFIIGRYLRGELAYCVWNRLYRRSIIEKYNLRFVDTKRICAEDVHFNVCYLAVASKIKTVGTAFYHYVVREGGLFLTSEAESQIGKMSHLCDDVEAFFAQHGIFKKNANLLPMLWYSILGVKLIYGSEKVQGRLCCLAEPEMVATQERLKRAYWSLPDLRVETFREFLSANYRIGCLLGRDIKGGFVERMTLRVMRLLKKDK